MAKKDFILSFFADSPDVQWALSALKQPFVLHQPQIAGRKYKEWAQSQGSVLNIWNSVRKPGDELGRVAVMGFSEGGSGVSAVLELPDAQAIDAVFPCDGIQRAFTVPGVRVLDPVMLRQFIAYGKLAAEAPPSSSPNTKLLCITHSSIGPNSVGPKVSSTTETAEVIWSQVTSGLVNPETAMCGFPCPAAEAESFLAGVTWPNVDFPLGAKLPGATITEAGWTTVRPSAAETNFLPSATFSWKGIGDGWTIRRNANNLHVFGWSYPTKNKTKDPTGNRDHVFQAQMVLPYMLRSFLVPRWNPACGPLTGLGIFGDAPMGCTPGAGKGYFDQEQKPLPDPFPSGIALPTVPPGCPEPPPGKVILGKPGDPCWTGDVAGEQSDVAVKVLGFAAGAVAGWFGAKWALKRWKR